MIIIPPKRCLRFLGIMMLLGLPACLAARAQDWAGSFTIIPVSAPELVLAGVNDGTADRTAVSLDYPSAGARTSWIITPKGAGFYTVQPSYTTALVLTVNEGKTDNRAIVDLETDNGKPWQLWSIRNNADGSISLVPKHAPAKGLDDFGGGHAVGARQDLWDDNPGDEHLEWVLKPQAGASVPAGQVNILDIPKGVSKEFEFKNSTIFPGTRRKVTVFIPAQYDGSKPACVYVQQDGYDANVKSMLERLIAGKDMPVTIGVFVQPGELVSPAGNTLGRRDRCFEYDGLGDNYVRFLTGELLPYVARTFDLKLSNSGNDHCIAGGSSGGISAFNAAWERPDAFSRVYACSGSFVAFRGGNEFPTLVRKFEAKPIRVYLTTGTHDMENCAGDWFLLDQEMDKALTFSGYDHLFRIIEGSHVAGWRESFPEAMRFLWKNWPEPIESGPGAPRVRDVINADDKWELLAQGYPGAVSPACNSAGDVFFINPAAENICRISLGGKVSVYINDAAMANGLCVGSGGELYTVSHRSGKVLCYDGSGWGRLVTDGIQGDDILAMPDGSLYVTGNRAKDGGNGKVWLVKAGQKTIVDSGLKLATGLACRPDQWLLSVADGHSKWVYSYQINPDGSLSNKERFFWLNVADGDDDTGAESVCYSREGQMFVATRLGIQICADDGPTQVILPLPDRGRVMGACLGGAGMNTLFAFDGDKIWKRLIKPHAVGAFSPINKVSSSPL